ncbi:hypothetical protein [Microseira sp. BLCC-F43]|uniref:hypothetical protein n=1 Tax=Microseira sp. BLCC-F43 TaxID=3153602 RepID=UPI0035B6E5B1
MSVQNLPEALDLAASCITQGRSLLTQSWGLQGIKASDSKRLVEIEKVKTNQVKAKPEYGWMKQYPSAIYSSALRNLAKAVDRWRKGDSG